MWSSFSDTDGATWPDGLKSDEIAMLQTYHWELGDIGHIGIFGFYASALSGA